jgi:arylsulfatase A-like enzyme
MSRSRRRFTAVCLAAIAGLFAVRHASADHDKPRPPNIILVFVDNFGNGDLGCFGSNLHRTPYVDQLAREGTRFTSFYVASGVCTPSRAALLTGCYPRRVNLHISDKNSAVLQPVAAKGLNPDEVTLAEILESAGYATTCIGKWHLGDQPAFLPTRQGFDEYFGIPYSDDMTKDKRPAEWRPAVFFVRAPYDAWLDAPSVFQSRVPRPQPER